MRFPYLINPNTGKPDVMVTLTVVVTLAATLKFLFDGVTVEVAGKIYNMGHVDPLTYGALLAPVLGAHSYIKNRDDKSQKAENPDVVE